MVDFFFVFGAEQGISLQTGHINLRWREINFIFKKQPPPLFELTMFLLVFLLLPLAPVFCSLIAQKAFSPPPPDTLSAPDPTPLLSPGVGGGGATPVINSIGGNWEEGVWISGEGVTLARAEKWNCVHSLHCFSRMILLHTECCPRLKERPSSFGGAKGASLRRLF